MRNNSVGLILLLLSYKTPGRMIILTKIIILLKMMI